MSTCRWTGRTFTPQLRGGVEKVFADDAARAAAHLAARRYTLKLIETGRLTWAELRAWSDNPEAPIRPPNTARRKRDPAEPELPFDPETAPRQPDTAGFPGETYD